MAVFPRRFLPFVGVMATGVLVSSVLATAAGAAPRRPSPQAVRNAGTKSTTAIERVGTTNVRALLRTTTMGSGGSSNASTELPPANHQLERRVISVRSGVPVPTPTNRPVINKPDPRGWEGIDHTDQRYAGGGNQFSLEPPDQGLCVGTTPSPNGAADGVEVMEAVNDAVAFYDSTTHQFGLPVTLSRFFGLAPTINRTTGRFGPFVSDPKCYFDVRTDRWFVTMLEIGQDPKTGDFTNNAHTYIAVSTSNEMLGGWYIYRINSLDRNHPGCPCFGDQPLIGADRYGFYVSTAEYALDCYTGGGCAFNGPQIYALSKSSLESGNATRAVHFANLTHVQGNRTTGTVQPATTPSGAYDTSNGGTEYFLSGFDCSPQPGCPIAAGTFDEITVWALTNTSSLNGTPALLLSLKDLRSEPWGTPVDQIQRPGPTPLATELGEPEGRPTANDSRMNQVVYAAGHLWSAINTIVAPGPRDGIAWFVVRPAVIGGSVNGFIAKQGYVAAAHAFLSFPSVGVADSGKGVIAFSLMGPGNYPSAAQVLITPRAIGPAVEITQNGSRPEDGFSCFPEYGRTDCRWGDYSASVATPDGTVFSATEFIGDNSRTYLANWSTFVWPVTLP